VEYRVFSQYCGGVVEHFLNSGSVTIGKSSGRAIVASPDVKNVQRNHLCAFIVHFCASFILINKYI
jgi:hypothetical protein